MISEQEIREYIDSILKCESDVMLEIRNDISAIDATHEEIFPSQSAFLSAMVLSCNAKKILEIGTAYGYSGATFVESLEKIGGGEFLTIEKDPERVKRARSKLSTLSNIVDVNVIEGEDIKTCQKLVSDGKIFDFIFVDSFEGNYPILYEDCIKLLNPRGTLIFDNVLMKTVSGWETTSNIVQDTIDPTMEKIRMLLSMATDDKRVVSSIIPIGSGFLMCVKEMKYEL